MNERILPSGIIAAEIPDTDEERMKLQEARKEWSARHCRCPSCGSSDREQTCLGYFTIEDKVNSAKCLACGWKGKVCDLVAAS